MAQLNGCGGGETLSSHHSKQPAKATLQSQPISQIARNRVFKQPTATPSASQRLANLANGIPTSHKTNGLQTNGETRGIPRPSSQRPSAIAMTPRITSNACPLVSAPRTQQILKPTTIKTATNRLAPPMTSAKLHQQPPRTSQTNFATTMKKPSITTSSISSSREALSSARQSSIPDTVQIRKGLAKFSNPMECQRQFAALNHKITTLEGTITDRDETVAKLRDQLNKAVNTGVGYATVVQYLALKLKLDSEVDLTKECENLKSTVSELRDNELTYQSKIETIINDYENFLQIEKDLSSKLEMQLQDTDQFYSNQIERLKEQHQSESDDLKKQHSIVEEELRKRVEFLETELDSTSKELIELRKEHELLIEDYSKLKESLTKDKDARVKYLQDKIDQLQKDVESLNSVLEMRTERIHTLEKDSLSLIEAQADLITHKDTIKSLNQQLESVNAALDKKREQFESLRVDHENLRQELKRERNERRRMTMKSEQLEFVLNESCASESNMVFDSTTIRDVDNDQLI